MSAAVQRVQRISDGVFGSAFIRPLDVSLTFWERLLLSKFPEASNPGDYLVVLDDNSVDTYPNSSFFIYYVFV